MDFRTNQYREQLKMEHKFAKRALDLLKAQDDEEMDPEAAEGEPVVTFGLQEGVDKPFLYDLVFEKEDSAHSGASKVSRCASSPPISRVYTIAPAVYTGRRHRKRHEAHV